MNFSAPTVLEHPPIIATVDGELKTFDRDGLDSEFEFTGYELFLQVDSVAMALQNEIIDEQWHLGGDFFLSVSEGKGKISSKGIANYQAASGTVITETEPTIQLFEYSIKAGAAKDFRFVDGSLMSMTLGYGVSWLAFSTESGGEFGDLKIFRNIYQHGPYLNVGAKF